MTQQVRPQPGSAISAQVSAIVPTIGRPESLQRLLRSLADQTIKPDEVIVSDGSDSDRTRLLVGQRAWSEAGLNVRYVRSLPPHAVRQRMAAIAESSGELLLMLDDDVELEGDCLCQMLQTLAPDAVAVMATFGNESWSRPTRLWRLYLRLWLGLTEPQWQGRVVGPLLRFGFQPIPEMPQDMQWLGGGMSLIRRDAFEAVGGFSDFFLQRSTINEDVDLGIRLGRRGRIVFCPTARVNHFHAPHGRVSASVAAEDDLRNRFLCLHRTQGLSWARAQRLVLLYFLIETLSDLRVGIARMQPRCALQRLSGRVAALRVIITRAL